MRKWLAIVLLLGIVLLAAGRVGYAWMTDAVVVVRNTGPVRLDAVVLEVGGGEVMLDPLRPNGTEVVKPEIRGDSGLRIRYSDGSGEHVCDGDVYFTRNLATRVEVDVGGGTCRVTDVT